MLQRKYCTAESPMQRVEVDEYYWIHADAVEFMPFIGNMVVFECPHCKFCFHAPARDA